MALSPQALRRLLRLATLIVPLATALAPNLANAEVKTGIESLDALFTQFVEGKNAQRGEALDAIAALERDDTREILNGILEGDLMLHKSTDTIVWATLKGREYSMQSLDRSSDLGKDSKRKLSRLKVTNRLRSHLRGLIAALGLRSEKPVQRLAAIDALMDSPEQLPDDTLNELLDSESDAKVLHALRALQARKLAASDNPEERLLALDTLQSDLSGSSRSLIQQLAASDTDKSVQDAAILVANRQAEK